MRGYKAERVVDHFQRAKQLKTLLKFISLDCMIQDLGWFMYYLNRVIKGAIYLLFMFIWSCTLQ